ncbi:hypothetical protein DSM112329_01265 [Paraconexibacter sp. AEG42_29]|uniref:DUF4333 domain-containing protein n=1 Tax=Paraconexibacter sp. AEG42_29 TaxID=2997339 RepID=A0AAU7ARZ5_9ACTN
MRSPKTLVLTAAVAAAALAAGCGETTIDADKAQKIIREEVAKQVGTTVKEVKCPEDEVAKKGDTFTCLVTGADGTKGDALVTQKDDEGNVRFNAPFVHTGNGERLIAERIESQSSATGVKVDCPDIVVGKQGDTFQCKATSANDSATVQVTQTDAKGGIDFKVLAG